MCKQNIIGKFYFVLYSICVTVYSIVYGLYLQEYDVLICLVHMCVFG